MPLKALAARSGKYAVKSRGGDLYITIDIGSSAKDSAVAGKAPKVIVTRVEKPGRYVVEKRSGKLYITEVGGASKGKKVLFRVRGKKAQVSPKVGLDQKLTKAFAAAVKAAR